MRIAARNITAEGAITMAATPCNCCSYTFNTRRARAGAKSRDAAVFEFGGGMHIPRKSSRIAMRALKLLLTSITLLLSSRTASSFLHVLQNMGYIY